MKTGYLVFVISDHPGLEPGVRVQVVALDGLSAWVLLDSPAERQVLPVRTWDLLPAKAYRRAVLEVVRKTVGSLEASSGSTLLLKPEQLVRKLVEHGLSAPAARQCVELLDTEQEAATPVPVREWLQRIKRHYGQGTVLQPDGPSD